MGKVLYQTTLDTQGFEVSGTADDWRREVGALCAGNTRLVFAVSMAFAAPLMNPLGMEGGGSHLIGASSNGKTTALLVGASPWGDPSRRIRTWRATGNGLEGVAALHNDCLLCLDEIGQVDGREAGAIAYMLANGQGKTRSHRDGTARPCQKWRTLFLSSGEISLAAHMGASGTKTRAGMEIRFLEIPADAGAGHGLFENIHGSPNGSEFSRRLTLAVGQYHGATIRAYLHKMVPDVAKIVPAVRIMMGEFDAEVLAGAAVDGQVRRALSRFSLIAAAGELATSFGLTGWAPGEAERAAKKCFYDWLNLRGGGVSAEETLALSQVRRFFEAHGESRFSTGGDWGGPTRDRVGMVKHPGGPEGPVVYWVFPESFKKEICSGLDHRFVEKILREKGILQPGNDGRPTTNQRIDGATKRVYVIEFKGETDELGTI